jgi:hypothetical protein
MVRAPLADPLIDGDGGGHRVRVAVAGLPISDGYQQPLGMLGDLDVGMTKGIELGRDRSNERVGDGQDEVIV